MTRHNFGAALTAALIMATAPACSMAAETDVQTPSPEQTIELSATVQGQLNRRIDAVSTLYGTAGASVAILRGDTVVYEYHTGFRDVEQTLMPDGDTAYTIWSMTKLFFDIEFLRLVEAGQIDLDATLGEVFTDLPERWSAITLGQAFSHISGLPDIWSNGIPADSDTALSEAILAEMEFETGARSQYNQTNFLLLLRHLEAVTGRNYVEMMDANQLTPLGLSHTSFDLTTAGADQSLNYRSARGARPQLTAIDLPFFPAFTRSSVGLQSSLNDLTRWTQALVRGELIARETLLSHWGPQYLNDGQVAEHTNGWEIELRGDVTAVGHGGGGRVNLRHYFRNEDPDQNLAVIYLDNGGLQNFNHRGLSATLADIIWPGVADPEERLFAGLVENAGGPEFAGAAAAFLEHANTTPDARGRREIELNRLGYGLLDRFDAATALPVFELQAAVFPESANAQDSFGEALRAVGNLPAARTQYARALELAPGNATIEAILVELDAEMAE